MPMTILFSKFLFQSVFLFLFISTLSFSLSLSYLTVSMAECGIKRVPPYLEELKQ